MIVSLVNTQHVSDIDFHLYSVKALAGLHLDVIEEHLKSCPECWTKAAKAVHVVEEEQQNQGGCHASSESLQGYLLGQLAPSSARKVKTHIKGCEACGNRLLSIQKLVAAVRPRRSL